MPNLPNSDSARQQEPRAPQPEWFVAWCAARAAADTDQTRRARVAAWLAEVRAAPVPFHAFPRDQAALEREAMCTREAPAARLARERGEAAHLAFRELFDGLRHHRVLRIAGPQRQAFFEAHVEEWMAWHARRAAALVRQELGSDVAAGPEVVPLDFDVPAPGEGDNDARPDPMPSAAASATRARQPAGEAWLALLAAAAKHPQLRTTLETAGPKQRQLLERALEMPGATWAEVARSLLGPEASAEEVDRVVAAATEAIGRLRRRAG